MPSGFMIEIDTMQPADQPQLGQAIRAEHAGALNTTITSASSTPQPAAEELIHTIPFDQIVFVVCASSIIAATIFGNVLVIIAVFAESKLRKVGNFFIVSLAVSDLLVGLFVTPVALVYNLLGSWTFGSVFCDIWIAMDVMCCTASIVNLCVISFDRYNAITQPLRYALRRTASRATLVIGLIWAYSAFIAAPPFLGMGADDNPNTTPSTAASGSETIQDQCFISQNVGYTIFSTVGAYYLPLVVMVVMYLKVFRATLKRKRNWIPLVRRESYEQSVGPVGSAKGRGSSVRRARVLINVADSTDRDDIQEELVERRSRRRAPKMSLLMTSLSLGSASGQKLGVTIHVPGQSSHDSLATTPSPDFREHNRSYLCSSIDELCERDAPSASVNRDVTPRGVCGGDVVNSRANGGRILGSLMASSTESAGDISDESGYEMSPQISPAVSSLFARRMSALSPSTSSRNYFKSSSRSSSEKRMLFQRRLNPSFTTTTTDMTTTPTTDSDETLGGDSTTTNGGDGGGGIGGRVRFSFSRRSCKFQFRVESEIQEEELSEQPELSDHRKSQSHHHDHAVTPGSPKVTGTSSMETLATTDSSAGIPPCVATMTTTTNVPQPSPSADDRDANPHLAQSRREKAITIERGRRRHRTLRRRRKNRISLNQERRAAKTLGIIMGCFITCWMPFFVIELLKPFCDNCHFSPNLLKAFTWLGYLNSALNPIIYTFFNQDFRKGFQRIICCSTKR